MFLSRYARALAAGTIATAALATSPAHAEDFTGPRAEIHAGYDRVDMESGEIDLDQTRDGITYGVGVGYDFAVGGGIIAGLEAGFDLSNVDFRAVSGTTTVEAAAQHDIDLAARVGTKVSDNVLLYAKGGYTRGRFEGALIVGGTTGPSRTEFHTNLDGVRLGGGVEVAFLPRAYGKVEYRYTDYKGGVSRHQVLTGVGMRF